MIKPTPGRIVWFKRGDTRPGEELAAIICKVTNDRLVNLAVFDVHGHPMSRIAVRLLQGDERPGPDCLSWCEWMPYQKGQAARTDVAEAKADAAGLDVSALAPRLARTRMVDDDHPAGPIGEGYTRAGLVRRL